MPPHILLLLLIFFPVAGFGQPLTNDLKYVIVDGNRVRTGEILAKLKPGLPIAWMNRVLRNFPLDPGEPNDGINIHFKPKNSDYWIVRSELDAHKKGPQLAALITYLNSTRLFEYAVPNLIIFPPNVKVTPRTSLATFPLLQLEWQRSDGLLGYWHSTSNEFVAELHAALPIPGNGWQVVANHQPFCNGCQGHYQDVLWRNPAGKLAVWSIVTSSIIPTEMLRDPPFLLDAPPVAKEWRVAAWEHLDENSSLDILWQHESGTLAVWYMRGPNLSSSKLLSSLPRVTPEWKLVAAFPEHDNGQLELLWQHKTSGDLAQWLVSSEFAFHSAQVLSISAPGPDWVFVKSGVFAADQRSGILWYHIPAKQFAVSQLSRGSPFTASTIEETFILQTPAPPPDWTFFGATRPQTPAASLPGIPSDTYPPFPSSGRTMSK